MNIEDKVRQHINDNGLTGVINQVNSLINNANLPDIFQHIYSKEIEYESAAGCFLFAMLSIAMNEHKMCTMICKSTSWLIVAFL